MDISHINHQTVTSPISGGCVSEDFCRSVMYIWHVAVHVSTLMKLVSDFTLTNQRHEKITEFPEGNHLSSTRWQITKKLNSWHVDYSRLELLRTLPYTKQIVTIGLNLDFQSRKISPPFRVWYLTVKVQEHSLRHFKTFVLCRLC